MKQFNFLEVCFGAGAKKHKTAFRTNDGFVNEEEGGKVD